MTIKLDHADVIKKLEAVSTAIGNLSISKMPDLGKSSLDTTEKWAAREEEIQTLVSTYIKALNKNVKDTKSNVDLLKEQDESIIHS
ncbi:YwqI/YxiC family protein [Priestia aryabhattai]|uniref:YwqI/YxiC family protein n=1 Tax=Priestia aryabhattai TaxID=412384 RepID=UPI001C0DFBBD|nr:YwqI/YxiC family protein [Priestia aryabhattai]MBU3569015.1 YwqI/YxiC family protein [Priestia aryabhattai]WDL87125.1 YwqI/YxiC family protein [Priestia aryabhattai]